MEFNFGLTQVLGGLAYIIIGPFIGGLLAGVDRKISAKMQGRYGPPLLQPFYDVRKLFEKEQVTVNNGQDFYVMCCLIFIIITGTLFFVGENLLLVIFALTTSSVFLVIAAYASGSPYSQIGAGRELLQMMAYEPMVLLMSVGLYMVKGSFYVSDIVTGPRTPLVYLIGVFIGYLYIITIKLRKSPFDLSMSHHAHQELVKGVTTEFSGRTLAALEVSHWYENVMLLGFVFLFFTNGTWLSAVIGVVACLVIYFIEILIDNGYARMKWQFTLKSSWFMTIIFGGLNILVLYILIRFELM
jgi:formate hydrogenlyase subunit 4